MDGNDITPEKVNDYSFLVNKRGSMNAPLRIFSSEKLMEHLKGDKSLLQGVNVASLPGIRGESLMMPDAHQGYGFSIGGVAAFGMDDGVISPGGIGFDINCGVRLVATSLKKDEVRPKIKELINKLYEAVPVGKGIESKKRLSDDELDAVLKDGPHALVKKGIGTDDDLEHCEEAGRMAEANPRYVSRRAKARGRKQLGTLGAGNHFLEVQSVAEVFDEETARSFGLEPDRIVFMIHCGSRGLGHQVASDYLREMEEQFPDIMKSLPEKDLIYAPIQSELAKRYYGAMCAAANFAWANRHMIAHLAKNAFKELFPEVSFTPVYDVAHNIAKKETHTVAGKTEELMVHRKGATRAFGPSSKEIPAVFQGVGQPVLIPGSMGTSSYILVGTDESMNVSFGSTAHGAGRLMSRFAAKKQFDGQALQKELAGREIVLQARSIKGVADEAPEAYKDVDEVVKVSHDAGIANLVVKLDPLGVIKG
ncbi:MAG: RtcB family protein [Candidatus Woesearchaeota archaeon]